MLWPFTDEQEFWAWADDPDAELAEQDEDLLLHDSVSLPLLLAAAERTGCPKRNLCANVLTDFARLKIGWHRTDVYPALRATAAHAATSQDPQSRRWADYVTRLFSYRERRGRVTRAMAEQMAADLLWGPLLADRMAAIGAADRLGVRIAPGGKHWQSATPDAYPTFLYVNRRTGGFRLVRFDPLSTAGLAAVT